MLADKVFTFQLRITPPGSITPSPSSIPPFTMASTKIPDSASAGLIYSGKVSIVDRPTKFISIVGASSVLNVENLS